MGIRRTEIEAVLNEWDKLSAAIGNLLVSSPASMTPRAEILAERQRAMRDLLNKVTMDVLGRERQ